ncbi:MAG: TIGR00730 family Rossman fold protein [Proteobacteria bacterium]|nr:TIGR00730 family Rossman fold protein [Pseudomonadota bacterium]
MKYRIKSVCVFCGAREGTSPVFRETAFESGRLLGKKGIKLVYGGSRDGLMGAAADGALAAGGEVLGVLPQKLASKELAHTKIQQLLTVDSMARRKDILMNESDLFLILPGGLGTLDELFEVLTANTLGFSDKPVVILNIDGFYSGLIDWLEKIAEFGLSRHPRDLFAVITDVASLDSLIERNT